jgi:DNA-binding transcriptional regulator YiaG
MLQDNYLVKTLSPQRVRKIRKALGLTQQQLAEALNLHHYSTVNRWENGKIVCSGPAVVALELLE